jgi:hypothetical protein
MSDPVLRKAVEFAERDIGSLTWDATHNSDILSVSDEGRCVAWGPRKQADDKAYTPVWVPIRSSAHLHSGTFVWDFIVDELAKGQIGVGFMLLWDKGLDWGFFGYLGAGVTAWAYDPSTGDVVTDTKSIAGDLPKFSDAGRGIVSVRLELPRTQAGSGTFIVDDVASPAIELPAGAVVVPAACLLREGQRIRLGTLSRVGSVQSDRSWRRRLLGN